jgi:hypothetical protein
MIFEQDVAVEGSVVKEGERSSFPEIARWQAGGFER